MERVVKRMHLAQELLVQHIKAGQAPCRVGEALGCGQLAGVGGQPGADAGHQMSAVWEVQRVHVGAPEQQHHHGLQTGTTAACQAVGRPCTEGT